MSDHIVKSFDDELAGLKQAIRDMGQKCEAQIADVVKAFTTNDSDLANQIIAADKEVNRFQSDIETKAVQVLGMRQPVAIDLRQLLAVLKISSELERIGDYTANTAKRILKMDTTIETEPGKLMIQMAEVCRQMIDDSMDSLLTLDLEQATAIWKKDDEVDSLFSRLVGKARAGASGGEEAIDDYTELIFMGRYFERIGDHITNIVENIYYIKTGQTYVGQLD